MTADEHITLERKRYFADLILDELARGPRRREDLKAACFAASMTEDESQSVFNGWGGTLRYLAETGRSPMWWGRTRPSSCARPLHPWRRKMPGWSWPGGTSPTTARPRYGTWPTSSAKPQREVKMWMAQLPLVHARVEGQDCFWLDNGQNDWPEMPDCLFLAGFDQLMLGYLKTESIFPGQRIHPGHLSSVGHRHGAHPAPGPGGGAVEAEERQADPHPLQPLDCSGPKAGRADSGEALDGKTSGLGRKLTEKCKKTLTVNPLDTLPWLWEAIP